MTANTSRQIHQSIRKIGFTLWTLRVLSQSLMTFALCTVFGLSIAYSVLYGWRGETVIWLSFLVLAFAIAWPIIYALVQAVKLLNSHRVALYIEHKVSRLNDALLTVLSAEQDQNLGAPEVVEALKEQVATDLKALPVSEVVPLSDFKKGTWSLFFGLSLCALAYWQDGERILTVVRLLNEQPQQLTQRLAYTPLIGDIKLSIQAPQYTNQAPRFIEGGSGDFEALKGSEITIEAILSRRAHSAQLWFKHKKYEDDQAVSAVNNEKAQSAFSSIDFQIEGRTVKAKFTLEHDLKWSVSLNDLEGVQWREAAERLGRINLDQAPSIKIISPLSGDRVDPAKDLKVRLEGKDDFGLSAANLFVALSSDMENPETLALNQVHGQSWKAEDLVDLRVVEAQGGDRLALWADIYDNRGTAEGPQKSTSEVIYLEIDSPQWAHRALLDQLREHLEVHIEALASRLELGYVLPDESELTLSLVLSRWANAREKSMTAKEGFETLLQAVSEDPLTPKEIYLTLTNHLMKLESSLETEENKMNLGQLKQGLGSSNNEKLSDLELNQVEAKSAQVEEAHEGIIIIIEAMVARMALEEMAQLADELKTSRAQLKELMKMYKDQPSDALKSRIRREFQRFKQKMRMMREMMKRLKQKLPEEFLNLDGMKNDEVVDSLKESEEQVNSIESLLEQGNIDEALKALDELSNSLEEMAQQLQQDMEELHRQTNPELEKALSELMDSARDLMKSQEEVKQDTQAQQDAIDRALEERLKRAEKLLEQLTKKAKRIKSIESQLSMSRQGTYIDRIREEAHKAADDLLRALEQIMIDESIGAANRSQDHFEDLERLERNPYGRRRSNTGETQKQLNEAKQLSKEIAVELEKLKAELEQQAQSARQEMDRQQREAQKQKAQQQQKEAERAQGQPNQSGQGQPNQSGQGQPKQSGQGQSGQGQSGQGQSSSFGQGLAQRQAQISERLKRLQERLMQRREKIPSLNQVPTEPFEQAQQGSKNAEQQLGQKQPGRGLEGQKQVSEALKQVMQGLQQAKKPQKGQQPGQEEQPGQGNPGSKGGPSTERVEVPKQDDRGPEVMRKKLLEAMKSKAARGYDDQVKAYYDSLVK